MTKNTKIERCVQYYSKRGHRKLAGRMELKDAPLSVLQKIFGEQTSSLMYEMYRINEDHALKLGPYIQGSLDLKKYNYYLECFSVEP